MLREKSEQHELGAAWRCDDGIQNGSQMPTFDQFQTQPPAPNAM